MIFKNLFRRKTRTLLTVLAIAVGVATVVALGAMAEGLIENHTGLVSSSDADLLVMQADALDAAFSDEPTGNLDTQSGMEVMSLLQEINRQRGMTILLVMHDPRVARTAQRILTMQDGRIVDDHTVGDPLSEDLRELARSLLGRLLLEGKAEPLAAVGLSGNGRLTPAAQTLAELLAAWV